MKGLDVVCGAGAFWVCLSAMFANGDLERFCHLAAMPAILLAILMVACLFALSVSLIPGGLALFVVCASRRDWQGAGFGLMCVASGLGIVAYFIGA